MIAEPANETGKESPVAPTIFTIGHSTRGIEEFTDLLTRNGVQRLIDVRRYPGSRRHPQFNREALAGSLEERSIGYRHAPELGGRRATGRTDSPNMGWRNASFRAYADHLASPEFGTALETVIREPQQEVVALMCAEAVPWRCHRQLISDALVARGHPVAHIISASDPKPHALNEMAQIDGRGRVTYPGEDADQQELFE